MSQRMRFIVSALCAVAAMLACILYGQQVRRSVERAQGEAMSRYGGEMVTLVVCTHALEAGEVVTAADLSERDWPSSLAPDDAVLGLDEAVGREISVPVAANAPLTALNFRDLALQADIPSGHVAVSVPITEKLGISQAVAAGTHVVAYRLSDGEAELIGGNAVILYSPSTGTGLSGRQSVTVAVASKDVPALLEASANGDLRLVIPADDVREFEGGKRAPGDVEPEVASTPEGQPEASGEGQTTAAKNDAAPDGGDLGTTADVQPQDEGKAGQDG